jgi:hypothetical protein
VMLGEDLQSIGRDVDHGQSGARAPDVARKDFHAGALGGGCQHEPTAPGRAAPTTQHQPSLRRDPTVEAQVDYHTAP